MIRDQTIPFSKLSEKEFVDLPATVPAVKFPLTKVGITHRSHYLSVLDPFTNEGTELFAEITILLDLPASQRGLHMARIEQALHTLRASKTLSLRQYVINLCDEVREAQQQKYCRVEISAHHERLVSKNISRKPSDELIRLHISGDLRDEQMALGIGVSVPFINACPCTQRWGMRDFYAFLESQGIEENEIKTIVSAAPLQAHTNRGVASLRVKSDEVDFEVIYAILEASTPLARELLSGQDEHVVIREAHDNGMLCEDVAREIVKNAVTSLDGRVDPNTAIEIIVEVDESIHSHNLYAEVQETFADLKMKLDM